MLKNNFMLKSSVVVGALIGLFALFLVLGGFTIIDSGEMGMIFRFGRYQYSITEGLNFKVPFIDTVDKVSIRDRNFNSKIEISSKDMQTIIIESTLVWAYDPDKLGDVYRAYKYKAEEIVIRPTVYEIINSVCASYPIEKFVESREEISKKILNAVVEKTAGTGIIIKRFFITNHDFSDEYNKAIENKKVAEQESLTAQYIKQKNILESEAQAIKTKTLSPLVLFEKAIDKWDGHLPKIMNLNGNMPMVGNIPVEEVK